MMALLSPLTEFIGRVRPTHPWKTVRSLKFGPRKIGPQKFAKSLLNHALLITLKFNMLVHYGSPKAAEF